jgi:IS30 family transposase
MNTSNVYQKHLTLDKRFKIEKGIDEKKSFTQIANDICKSNKTVSNEILRNRNIVHCTSWYGKEKICEKTLKPPYVCQEKPLFAICVI